jgi:tRNA threonylcarbamoyladenosine biosynthesis protein TsaE
MEIISSSFNETLKIGRLIAKYLGPQDIICLSGKLGSGKTVLAKGIAAGLGIEAFNVTSSSFVIIREHLKGRLPFYHFDLYRLKTREDISVLGYEEYFYGDGVSVIEWPERLGCFMPPDYLEVELSYRGETNRGLKFKAKGPRYKKILKEINENICNRHHN